MSEERAQGDDYDIKQCGRCAAWIPRTATMCSYCGTSSPDVRVDPRVSLRARGPLRGLTVTRALMAANCLYFLFALWVQRTAAPDTRMGPFLIEGGTRGQAPWGFLLTGWYDHGRVAQEHEWWRVMTAVFLHGGLIHLAVNMWSLNVLGRIAEELFGATKTLAVYLVCGACSTLAVSVWFAGALGRSADEIHPMLGASGAIFGLGGLIASFLLRHGTDAGRRVGWSLAQNLALMLLLGLYLRFVSNTGHVGGLIPGVLFGLTLRDKFSTRISPEARRNWWLAAALAVAVAGASLANGAAFTFRHLGDLR